LELIWSAAVLVALPLMATTGVAVPSPAVVEACSNAFADVPVADVPAVPAVAVLAGVVGFAAVTPGVATATVNSRQRPKSGRREYPAALRLFEQWPGPQPLRLHWGCRSRPARALRSARLW